MNKNFEYHDCKEIMRWNPEQEPLFWMHEQTGMMKTIVQKFLDEIHLTNLELKYLKWYIVQWIDGTVSHAENRMSKEQFKEYVMNAVPKDYKKQLDDMDQGQIIQYVSEDLINLGIDPF